MSKSTKSAKIRKIAKDRFGYEQLREGQEEAITSIVEGRDTLVIQPTGSGKSAIYQVAGLMINGPTVIVSPLIALQKDQVDSIRNLDIAEAAVVNSAQKTSELKQTFEKLGQGDMEFLFLSPEQFANEKTRSEVIRNKPSLFVIDEAHCISEWGHDFRPDYLKLGAVIDTLGHPPVLAMTATAAPEVRDEIVERLHMREPKVIVTGFDRPNIYLGVTTFPSDREKVDALIDSVSEEPKPGIVYCATRKTVEDITAAMIDRGISAVAYHGGMRAKDREDIQNKFMAGECDVIVSTNAFGMGVDKSDVRFVFHAEISDSLDSYYQEIGRAGRDGEPSRAVLFYRPENMNIQKFLKGGGLLEEEKVQAVAELIHNEEGPVDMDTLKDQTGLSERKLIKTVSRLEEQGAVETLPSGEISAAEDAPDLSEAAKAAVEEQKKRKEHEALRLEKMRMYAEMSGCRREYLLSYFGDHSVSGNCGNCDNCLGREEKPQRPFEPGSRVEHVKLGRGVVERYQGGNIVVLFDDGGRTTLSVKFLKENNLLKPAA